MKTLTLCADDYSQSPAISATILELLEAGRLSATSVFSLSPWWREDAASLVRHADHAEIGLHFNLTHHFSGADQGLEKKPLSYWLLRSQLGRLSWDSLYDEMMRQIDAFANAMGRLPDFIDGHQHVHAFPLVRNVLTEVIRQRWRVNQEPWVRAPDRLMHAGDDALKARVLRFACRDFAWHLEVCGIDYPRWFGGFYSMRAQADYAACMRAWLDTYPDGSLLMCHPGPQASERSRHEGDPTAAVRGPEAAYLGSAEFARELEARQVRLGRFRDPVHARPVA